MSHEGIEPTTAEPAELPYDPRFVAAALAAAGLSIGAAILGLGLMVGMSRSTVPLAPVMATLLLIQVPGALTVLVLSIFGRMWRRGLDAATTAVLLATTLGADLMLWPFIATQTNVNFVAFGNCVSPFGSCSSDDSADLWIGVGIQTLLLALVLSCLAHWLWRLRPTASERRTHRLALLGIAVALAAVIAAIDANIDAPSVSLHVSDSNGQDSSVGPGSGSGDQGGSVILVNDLGHTVRLVYCPHQNCSHQKARTMASGATAMFKAPGGVDPDSFVVLGSGSQPVCQTVDGSFPGGPPGAATQPLSSADPESCGMDVDTLTVPH